MLCILTSQISYSVRDYISKYKLISNSLLVYNGVSLHIYNKMNINVLNIYVPKIYSYKNYSFLKSDTKRFRPLRQFIFFLNVNNDKLGLFLSRTGLSQDKNIQLQSPTILIVCLTVCLVSQKFLS